MESIPLLRKLSLKSKLSFGKYQDNYVGQVLEYDHSYLAFIYYNIAGLSFTDDILERLGIVDKFVIEKPGTNIETFERFRSRMISNEISELSEKNGDYYAARAIIKAQYKKRARGARYTNKMNRRTETNKAYLQAQNQGHIPQHK